MSANDQSTADLLAKLLTEVTRLRVDVVKLLDRIEPYEDTSTAETAKLEAIQSVMRPLRTNEDVRQAVLQLKVQFGSTHYHLNAIRGRLEEIAGNAILRDELQPWIKPSDTKRKAPSGRP